MPKDTNSGYMGGWMGDWLGDWMGQQDEAVPPTTGVSRGYMGDWMGPGWMGDWMGKGGAMIVAIAKSPRQTLHGWNKRRLLQWGGRFKPA